MSCVRSNRCWYDERLPSTVNTWLPKPKGDHGSHQALFMTATPDGIAVERLDVRTGGKIAPDIEWGVHKQGTRKDNPPKQTLRPL